MTAFPRRLGSAVVLNGSLRKLRSLPNGIHASRRISGT
jgi:hypothetical protein